MNCKEREECQKCGLYHGCKHPCIKGRGDIHAKIMLVGEAPGRHEDVIGQPFVGDSGKLLEKILKSFDLQDKVYITNMVKCRPPDNATPSIVQTNCCKPLLTEEIERIQPKVLILLGKAALKGMLDRSDITKARGTIHRLDGCVVIPTFHPAYALRNPSMLSYIVKDFATAVDVAQHGIRQTQPKKYRVLQDVKQGQRLLEFLKNFSGPIAVDVEGKGKNPFVKDYKLACFSFSYRENEAFFIPCQHPDNRLIPAWLYKEIAKVLLTNLDIQTCFQYGYHDVNAFKVALGIRCTNYADDTIHMHALLDENSAHDLDTLTSMYLPDMVGYKGKMQEQMRRLNGDMTRIPMEAIIPYNCNDAIATLRLRNLFLPDIYREKLDYVYHEVMRKGANVLCDIGYNGMAMDRQAITDADVQFKQQMDKMLSVIRGRKEVKETIRLLASREKEEAEKKNGKSKPLEFYYKEFKPNSSKQKQVLLYEVLKLPVKRQTKKKQPATDKKTLALYKKHKICQMLTDYSKVHHLWSTYIKPVDEWLDTFDSRVHCSFNLHVARTGRPSANQPNMLNIPRSKTDNLIKNCFVARPGYKLVQFDFSQMELRVLACYAKEPVMISAFQEGRDIHREFAAFWKKIAVEDVTDALRQIAKGTHFGIIYGMMAKALAERTGCSIEEAEDIIKTFFRRYPKIKKWIDHVIHECQRHKEVISLIGRRRRLPDIVSTDEYIRGECERQAVNSPIQGLATDMMLLQLHRINKYIRKNKIPAFILMTVYDSILFEVREDIVNKFVPKIKAMIEDFSPYQFDWLVVPIVADAETGYRWGSMEKFDNG